jgi:antirestriction protein ArdC
MSAQSIISRYKHMDGNTVSGATLREFHDQIQKHLDGKGSGPFTKAINGIRSRLANVLKNVKSNEVVKVKIDFKDADKAPAPEPAKKKLGLPPAAKKKKSIPEKHRSKIKAQNKRMPKPMRDVMNIHDVHGLELNPPETIESGLGFTQEGQQKIYNMVTDRVVETMKKDGLFWRKKWDAGGAYNARSFPSKNGYRGANWAMLTLMANVSFGYSSPYFMTFKGVKSAGGSVRKKAESWPVVYYNAVYKLDGKPITEERYNAMTRDEQKKVSVVPFIQYYLVFNGQDIEGIDMPKTKKQIELESKTEFERIEYAEGIVSNMRNRPDIDHGSRSAHYLPNNDKIDMPDRKAFDNAQDYYSVLFHELIHSTGHKSRIGRTMSGDHESKEYFFEELVAELGASYLCAEAGILYHTLNDSANYVKHYSDGLKEIMKDDKKFFMKAAAAAQKACDFILNVDTKARKKTNRKAFQAKSRGKKKRVAEAPKSMHESKRSRPPVKRKERSKATAEHSKKPEPVLNGFMSADQAPAQVDTFTIPNEIGKFIGTIQPFKYEIVIAGETHSGKSEVSKQIADAFAEAGKKVGYIDWEHGGLESIHTKQSFERNVTPANRAKIKISGSVAKTLDAVKALAKHFDVIILDSGTKLNEQTNAWIDTLREEYPQTIWVIVMQQNTKGGTRGGTSAEFDAPVVIKTYRPDQSDHAKNYAVMEKNRGNKTGDQYLISSKRIRSAEVETDKQKAA